MRAMKVRVMRFTLFSFDCCFEGVPTEWVSARIVVIYLIFVKVD